MSYRLSLIILIVSSILLSVGALQTLAQTCASNYDIYPTVDSNICPIGFINMDIGNGSRTCAPYTTFMSSVLGGSCSNDASCYLASLGCFNGICDYKKTRSEGDECKTIENCMEGLNCVRGTCMKFVNVNVGQGEKCGIYNSTENTYSVCSDNRMCHNGYCVNCILSGINETCNTYNMQSYTHTKCSDGLVCVSGVCNVMTILKEGDTCDPNSITSVCPNELVCRITRATKVDRYECAKYAKWGQFCDGDSLGCESKKIGSSGLALCYNGKCSRVHFYTHEKMCTLDKHCYSGTCREGTCFRMGMANTLNCNDGLSCPGTFHCSCNGTSSGTGSGVCFATCAGFVHDVSVCLWNNGFSNTEHMLPGNGKNQIVDTKSSAFLKCKSHYEAAYSCLKQTSKTASVYLSTPTLPGLDISAMAMSRPTIVVMPGGSFFNTTSGLYQYPTNPIVSTSSPITPINSTSPRASSSNIPSLGNFVIALLLVFLSIFN